MVAGHPDPGHYLVVTSDRWLVERVRDLGAEVEPSLAVPAAPRPGPHN